MQQQIQLYDLARRQDPNTCWSYNVWKTRLALNYKQLPYNTIWVDHNTLVPTLKSLGIPPNAEGFEYTVPTIVAPDGTVITDSAAIAPVLERLRPIPSLHLDQALQAEAEAVAYKTAKPLFADYKPRVARQILRESTVEAFVSLREKRIGMSLDELEKTKGGEPAWTAAAPGFAAMKSLLTERKQDDGPFILGSKVCYADFILVAVFESLRHVGQDMFDRALSQDESFAKIYEASKPWFAGNQ